MIIDLTKSDKVDLSDVGGKAYNLHRLASMGMPVPSAVVKTSLDYHELAVRQVTVACEPTDEAARTVWFRLSSGLSTGGQGYPHIIA